MNQSIACICMLFLISGCATVDDYRNLSPNQRADKACRNRPEFNSMASQKKQYDSSILSIQSDLSRGYKVHTQCRQIEVAGDTSTSCNTSYFGNNGYTNCTETRPKEVRQVCQETPVPINAELEKGKLTQMQEGAREIDSKLRSMWGACIKHVSSLSSEQAFEFSKGR